MPSESELSCDSQSTPAKRRKVVYVYDSSLALCTDKITHLSGRSRMVHELITAHDLLQFLEVIPGRTANRDELIKFHSQDYVDLLLSYRVDEGSDQNSDDNQLLNVSCDSENTDGGHDQLEKYGFSVGKSEEGDLEEFGLGYDCPLFEGLGNFAERIAGGTLAAAEALINGADIVMNWCGGWHHAQRSEASGFCYVNDIVLGIQELQKRFKHILYVDIDAHHGDGVENAFSFSNKVATLSFHHFDSGYFPGTGKSEDVGNGRGKYFAFNAPFKAGLSDQQFMYAFDSVFNSVHRTFQPDAIVFQCGADCLAKDPLGAFNLSLTGVLHSVTTLLGKNVPTLLLGGGGYNLPNAARLWTAITAETVGKRLENDIPDNKYFLEYKPDFELQTQPSLRRNENDADYIEEVIHTISAHLSQLKTRLTSS